METPAPIYAADRLTSIIEELCRILTNHGRKNLIAASVLVLIWNRITRMARRFASLAERVHSGTLSATARRRDAAVLAAGLSDAPPARPADTLPNHFRWLLNMLPEAEALSADLCWLLRRPEMEALIFEAPQAGRILRPFCRMLGIDPPSALRPPRRARLPAPQENIEPEAAPPQHLDDSCRPDSHPPEPPGKSDAEVWADFLNHQPPPKMD